MKYLEEVEAGGEVVIPVVLFSLIIGALEHLFNVPAGESTSIAIFWLEVMNAVALGH